LKKPPLNPAPVSDQTFRPPILKWLLLPLIALVLFSAAQFLYALYPVAVRGRDYFLLLTPFFVIAPVLFIGALSVALRALNVNDQGFISSGLFFKESMRWGDVKALEFTDHLSARAWIVGLLFLSYSSKGRPRFLVVSRSTGVVPSFTVTYFRSEDLKRFVLALRKKAPQAKIEDRILGYLQEN
jgi:hypothetical protein